MSPSMIGAIHRVVAAAITRGIVVEVMPNGHLRFRKGGHSARAQVLDDGATIGNWRTGDRAPMLELKAALS